MSSTSLVFSSRAEHRAWLAANAALPRGFRVGASRFDFTPIEVPKPAKMTVTLIALDDGAQLSGLQRIVENDAQEPTLDPSQESPTE